MFDFLRVLIGFFDKHNIPYMLSGSMAMSVYTAPRYTRDFDFIVYLKPTDVIYLREYFKEGYYFDEDSVIEAIKTKGMFNIIDHKSNYKADFIVLKNEEYELNKFERRSKINLFNFSVYIIAVEDLLISKLIWNQQLQSALQETDIKQIANLDSLDRVYIWTWIEKLKLNTFDLIKK